MPFFNMIPLAFLGLLFYGLIFFCIWKFYEILVKMNENIAGIRRAVEASGGSRPSEPV